MTMCFHSYDKKLKLFASNPTELRRKVVTTGFELYLSTSRYPWPSEKGESTRQWKRRMLRDGVFIDETFLQLLSDISLRDICIVPIFSSEVMSIFLQFQFPRSESFIFFSIGCFKAWHHPDLSKPRSGCF